MPPNSDDHSSNVAYCVPGRETLVEHMDRMSRFLIKMTQSLPVQEREAILAHQWRLEAILIDMGVLPSVFEPRYLSSQYGTQASHYDPSDTPKSSVA